MPKRLFYRRVEITDMLTNLAERVVTWGPVMIGTIGSGGVSAWAAYGTEFLSAYAPISWVAAAFLGALTFTLVYWLWQLARLSLSKRQYSSLMQEKPLSINTLEDSFHQKKININDFANPFHEWVEGKTFVNCHIYGPAIVFFSGGFISDVVFKECDFIKVKNDASVTNCIAFDKSTIRQCRLYCLTILMPEKFINDLPNQGKDFHWLN